MPMPNSQTDSQTIFADGDVLLCAGEASSWYATWEAPTVIVADGPYGLSSFPGDPPTPEGLSAWYEPHVRAWYERALPCATLWFWNSEQGWANCHRMIEAGGWEFRNCHIWDKGIAHIAGNCNTATIRKFPVITEVCVQYVRRNRLPSAGRLLELRDWLRQEWRRSGLPFQLTNTACGVRNAATRKYFTGDHLWYFPPPEAFQALVAYANAHGRPEGRPYFSADGARPLSREEWERMRAKFNCALGVTNVWREPAVRGQERLRRRRSNACLHMNQKPLRLLECALLASSDPGDVVWEPFGGLCSVALAAWRTGRRALASEINPQYYTEAVERFRKYESEIQPGLPALDVPRHAAPAGSRRAAARVGAPYLVGFDP